MRVGELASAKIIDNKFIECETEKVRKGYTAEFRKIPITPMLQRLLPHLNLEKAQKTSRDIIRHNLQKVFPEHHTHELRYTFITRVKEVGCNLEIVMLWAGHKFDNDVASSKVDRGYKTYSLEYHLQQAEKVNYDL